LLSNSLPDYHRDNGNKPSRAIASRNYKNLTNLNSGSAAINIADSFLNSLVGRELLGHSPPAMRDANDDADHIIPDNYITNDSENNSSDDSLEEPLTLLQRQQLATTLLGISNPPIRRNIPSFQEHPNTVGDYQTVKERQEEQTNPAHRLSPGWHSSSGGWVAEFGAPHTHALYTGRDVLDGVSIVEDRQHWTQQRRAEITPVNGIIPKLAKDLQGLEVQMREGKQSK